MLHRIHDCLARDFDVTLPAVKALRMCQWPEPTNAPPMTVVPLKVRVWVPAWVSDPLPLMLLATVWLSLRLNTKAALSVMTPVPNAPEVPPLPICRVPPWMLVVPV